MHTDNKASHTLKNASIAPIVSDSGRLSGMLIEGEEQLKIRVQGKRKRQHSPKLELWNERSEEWVDFTFKVRFLSQ